MRYLERLTTAEQQWRDRVIGAVVQRLAPEWLHPNHLTALRLGLTLIAMACYFTRRPLSWQIWLLSIAALSDTCDGVVARTRKRSSSFGAQFDYVTDWFLGAWTGFLTISMGLLKPRLIAHILIPQLFISAADWLRAKALTESREAGEVMVAEAEKKKAAEVASEASEAREAREAREVSEVKKALHTVVQTAQFHANTLSRARFTYILTGLLLLTGGMVYYQPLLHLLGLAAIIISIILSWLLAFNNVTGLMQQQQQQQPVPSWRVDRRA
ncbi:MAG TPA: CDP-alcohol phosphatidyltransferase family protein [Firmicutes bacterium]|nr:CDP-alcohol phosphatidyltransferase family protein [Bacillota bacterium]